MFVGCLTSQQQASVSQGRICSDNFTCCHTEIEVADPTFYLTQSQYTDTGPTSPSADPLTPGAWQGSRWSANFEVTGMTRPRKKSRRKPDSNLGPSALEADALTTRPTRRGPESASGWITPLTPLPLPPPPHPHPPLSPPSSLTTHLCLCACPPVFCLLDLCLSVSIPFSLFCLCLLLRVCLRHLFAPTRSFSLSLLLSVCLSVSVSFPFLLLFLSA